MFSTPWMALRRLTIPPGRKFPCATGDLAASSIPMPPRPKPSNEAQEVPSAVRALLAERGINLEDTGAGRHYADFDAGAITLRSETTDIERFLTATRGRKTVVGQWVARAGIGFAVAAVSD